MDKIQTISNKLNKPKLSSEIISIFQRKAIGRKQSILVNKLTPEKAVAVCKNLLLSLNIINQNQVKARSEIMDILANNNDCPIE